MRRILPGRASGTMGGMDVSRVMVLREVLAGSGWIERTRSFAHTLRTSTRQPGGLLLVGTPDEEPWHLAAHLGDEARLSGVAELVPTLVRYAPPPDAPAHLSVTMARLEAARRGETVFVVAEDDVPEGLLSRAWDARKLGATVLAIDSGQTELESIAHESIVVPTVGAGEDPGKLGSPVLPQGYTRTDSGLAVPSVSFDTVQHLVSVAVGEAPPGDGRRGLPGPAVTGSGVDDGPALGLAGADRAPETTRHRSGLTAMIGSHECTGPEVDAPGCWPAGCGWMSHRSGAPGTSGCCSSGVRSPSSARWSPTSRCRSRWPS